MPLETIMKRILIEIDTRMSKAWKSNTDVMGVYGKKMSRVGKVVSDAWTEKLPASKAIRKWLGLALSLMFISQSIAAIFSRMVTPVMQITGLFEVWKAMLISVLSPIIIPITKFLVSIMKIFMGLNKNTKITLGLLVVILLVIATLVSMFAMMLTLVNGLLPALTGLVLNVSTIGQAFALIGTCLVYAAAILLVIIADIKTISDLVTGRTGMGILRFLGLVLTMLAGIIAATFGAPALLIAAIVGIVAFLTTLIVDEYGQRILNWIDEFIGKCNLNWLKILIIDTFTEIKTWLQDNWTSVIGDIIWGPLAPFKWAIEELMNRGGVRLAGPKNLPEPKAVGGLVTKPTMALLGEHGPERVVPLTGGLNGEGINININGTFGSQTDMRNLATMIQIALRDELYRLGYR